MNLDIYNCCPSIKDGQYQDKEGVVKILIPLLIASTASAYDFLDQTKKELELLKKDPKQYYLSPTTKLNSTPRLGPVPYARHEMRLEHFAPWADLNSEIRGVDNVRNLVFNFRTYERNIESMKRRGLNEGRVKIHPWTGHYFPFYRGIAGNRYNDFKYNEVNNNWVNSYKYIKAHPAEHVYWSGDEEAINSLAPSEKYDLIMDTDFALTHKMWDIGRYYQDKYGKVAIWMGICHGWAPASFVLDRPLHTITIPSARQRIPIKFYPTDIKALGALLWAKNGVRVNFIGGRCYDREPRVDSQGRPINPDCNDTNPGTFHMAMINQIGILKRPIIMDTSFDHEVWNSPIVSYKFTFFNPFSKLPTEKLEDAIVDANARSNSTRWVRNRTTFSDPRRQHRAPGTRYLVGISAEIEFSVETVARQYDVDEAQPYDPETGMGDKTNKVIYLYDLELDENYDIIGGEWYKKEHPDFLWTPRVNTDSFTEGDRELADQPRWDVVSPVPYDYTEQAKAMAEKRGAPLSLVVEKLIELSRQKQEPDEQDREDEEEREESDE